MTDLTKENEELIEKVRAVARKHGWAIGVHGSLRRDIDLIAVPWTEEASGTFDLYEALKKAVGGELQGSSIGNLGKPHGRQALMILQKGAVSYKGKNGMDDWNPPALDISFVDPRSYVGQTKAGALLDAVRQTDVGSDVIIHNEDMSIFCILTVKCKEHPEKLDEDGGRIFTP